jgi:hypothetical protein
MEDRVNQIKNKIVPLLKKCQVNKAGIFGSFVRGEESSDSDVDILVEFSPTADISLLEVAGLKVDLEEALGRKVDLVQYEAIRPELKEYILPEEVRIYEEGL